MGKKKKKIPSLQDFEFPTHSSQNTQAQVFAVNLKINDMVCHAQRHCVPCWGRPGQLCTGTRCAASVTWLRTQHWLHWCCACGLHMLQDS